MIRYRLMQFINFGCVQIPTEFLKVLLFHPEYAATPQHPSILSIS